MFFLTLKKSKEQETTELTDTCKSFTYFLIFLDQNLKTKKFSLQRHQKKLFTSRFKPNRNCIAYKFFTVIK